MVLVRVKTISDRQLNVMLCIKVLNFSLLFSVHLSARNPTIKVMWIFQMVTWLRKVSNKIYNLYFTILEWIYEVKYDDTSLRFSQIYVDFIRNLVQ